MPINFQGRQRRSTTPTTKKATQQQPDKDRKGRVGHNGAMQGTQSLGSQPTGASIQGGEGMGHVPQDQG